MENLPKQNYSLEQMIEILVDIAVLLISNGANTTRTVRNLKRIAEPYGFDIEPFFSHAAVILTVTNPLDTRRITIVRTIPHYGVNYSIVSEISILSWTISKQKLSFETIIEDLEEIRHMNSYSESMKILAAGIATAALCKVFDGNNLELVIAFLAGVIGFLGRRVLIRKKYNINVSWLFAAFVSTSVVNVCRLFGLEEYHGALTACVLWLIPGVPLINGFLDSFSGHIVSGCAKIAMGFFLMFMIALGFYLSVYAFGYGFDS